MTYVTILRGFITKAKGERKERRKSKYPVAIQVIECQKLSLMENLWLKGLNNHLQAADATIILEESRVEQLERMKPASQ
jgi:hypothetical protein